MWFLKQLNAKAPLASPACFNPCFDGCGSSSSQYLTLGSRLQSVSILVLMDVVPQEEGYWSVIIS